MSGEKFPIWTGETEARVTPKAIRLIKENDEMNADCAASGRRRWYVERRQFDGRYHVPKWWKHSDHEWSPLSVPTVYGCRRMPVQVKAFAEWDEAARRCRHSSSATWQPYHQSLRPAWIVDFAGPFGCGRCEGCLSRKVVQKASNVCWEAKAAILRGEPVAFWTLTLRNEEHLLSEALARRTTVWKDYDGISAGCYHRSRMPVAMMLALVWQFRVDIGAAFSKEGQKVRMVTTVEPHEDGALHAHAVTFGVDPAVLGASAKGANKHGNETWVAESGLQEFWPRGRVMVSRVARDNVEQVARYVAKYAMKSTAWTQEQIEARSEFDQKGPDLKTVGWPRPMAGKDAILAIANDPDEVRRVFRSGPLAFRECPLDRPRQMLFLNAVGIEPEQWRGRGAEQWQELEVAVRETEALIGREVSPHGPGY